MQMGNFQWHQTLSSEKLEPATGICFGESHLQWVNSNYDAAPEHTRSQDYILQILHHPKHVRRQRLANDKPSTPLYIKLKMKGKVLKKKKGLFAF